MANKGTIPKGGKPGQQNSDSESKVEKALKEIKAKENNEMASERESRGADNRDSRMGTENREVNESRENKAWHNDLRIHAKNTDDYSNPYDNFKVAGDKYELGWFPDRSPIPPGYRAVPFECLDDEVRGNYDSMRKGQLNNIVASGDLWLYAIEKSKKLKQLDDAEKAAAINMKMAMEKGESGVKGVKAKMTDLGSGRDDTVQLDG